MSRDIQPNQLREPNYGLRYLLTGAVITAVVGSAGYAIYEGVEHLAVANRRPDCIVPFSPKGEDSTLLLVQADEDQIVNGIAADGTKFNTHADPLHIPEGSKLQVASVDPQICRQAGGIVLTSK